MGSMEEPFNAETDEVLLHVFGEGLREELKEMLIQVSDKYKVSK
jgi:hypothetical protein